MRKITLFLLASSALTLAIASTAPPPPPPAVTIPPRPKPKKAPGAPVINDMTTAYQYRTLIKMDPACTRFATEADNAFLSATLDDAQKTAIIKNVEAQARAANCLMPQ